MSIDSANKTAAKWIAFLIVGSIMMLPFLIFGKLVGIITLPWLLVFYPIWGTYALVVFWIIVIIFRSLIKRS